jgi:Outer membrane protein beta-barrel domain
MARWVSVFVVVLSLAAVDRAFAQDTAPGPGRAEITLIPGGGFLFLENKDASAPSFGNYQLGGAVAYNFNRFVAVEGEVGTSLGISQSLDFGYSNSVRTPDILTYSGNLVVSLPSGGSVVPYVAGGAGGLSLFKREELGVDDTETLFTGNVGAGVKWYAGRWGLRADYRFVAVPSRDEVSAFGFGTEARYGHRVYGAVLLNVGG